ncbi:MAG: hypothetical protein M1821_002123 [Bathelium mastoideum]|nr:MAG: hypothetical protein M1821_002123 [Bathelium mastoideum]KAI9684993.1 MAG: hypothetical protein M1822_005385 [Bathelium mastoideum]
MDTSDSISNVEACREGVAAALGACSPLPDGMHPFRLLDPTNQSSGARLGKLLLSNRNAVQTPHYLAITSRGIVPHLSQDNLQRHTNITSAYVAIEDFLENAPIQTPPIFKQAFDHGAPSSLRNFISFPKDTLLILAPRRIPPVYSPNPSRKSDEAPNRSILVSTSAGFQVLDIDEYIEDVQRLKPDLVIGMSDSVIGKEPGRRRVEKMVDRTTAWTRRLLQCFGETQSPSSLTSIHILAPILPLDAAAQAQYLATLENGAHGGLCGLALYGSACMPDLPKGLRDMMCLSLDDPGTPHKVLDEVALGIDLFALPFLGTASDAGLALDFAFPAPNASNERFVERLPTMRPLATDVWLKEYAVDVRPLCAGCCCYTCRIHNRAYIHHLLNAKEMLAWVLLQIHNHHVVDTFFAGVRNSISKGSFEDDAEGFTATYEPEFPRSSGQGPRVRGYQIKSEGPGERRKNPLAYNTLDDIREKVADAPLELSHDARADKLDHGLGKSIESEALPARASRK